MSNTVDDLLEAMGVSSNGHGDAAGQPTPEQAADALTKLLALHTAGLKVTGGRIVGRGSQATADIYLSDGSAIYFASLATFASPSKLTLELCAHAGVQPKLNAPKAIAALSLLRRLAEMQQTESEDSYSVGWGLEFLQEASQLDVDMTSQDDRWRAFESLRGLEPEARARTEGIPLARGAAVLVDADGLSYVRTGWFREHVRRQDALVSPAQIATRMLRVGWQRRGGEGLIKATRPGFRDQLSWSFWIVPSDWRESRLESAA